MRICALRRCLEREGDLGGALRHLLGTGEIAPANAEVHLKLGLLYRKRGESQTALKSFLRALECDPASVESHRNAAELYDAIATAATRKNTWARFIG